MRVNNPRAEQLLPELQDSLVAVRAERGFDATKCLQAKTQLLNDYLRDSELSSVVIAVSGGIDSAVVLGIIKAAAENDDVIKSIVPVCLPVFSPEGASNQKQALQRGKTLIQSLDLEPRVIDLTEIHSQLRDSISAELKIECKPWANGQLVAYARTPVLYFITSLLTESGSPGLICGTTNRDEGAYLGYVGKASDGMVDLQLIADLHKSEVYSLAAALRLPKTIINAVPTGDMFDGREDEEVFGSTYDFVELYLSWLCLSEDQRDIMSSVWSETSTAQFQRLSARLEKLHEYNGHKYSVGSPAVHLNVYPSAVPGGWNE